VSNESAPDLPSQLREALRGFGLPEDDRALVAGIRQVSEAYNGARFPVAWTPEMEAARIAFFLPRDVRKIERALRDVPIPKPAPGEPLRVLDLGCGVGASALGAVMAVRASGWDGPVEVTLVEPDARALARAEALLLAARDGTMPMTVRAHAGSLTAGTGAHELVVLGQVLVEVAHGRPEEERVRTHARLLRELLRDRVAPEGLLLVVEPALRVTARRLQAVRAELLAGGGVHVRAPCPHDGPCPLLQRETDWCHEDLPVDLPASLAPLARAAGLRWQGLTHARLVLAKAPGGRPAARVAAAPKPSRGKHTLALCVPDAPTLREVDRLDRHASASNAAWTELARGDGLDVDGGIPARIGPEHVVAPASRLCASRLRNPGGVAGGLGPPAPGSSTL
jgi:ribosomal protein RSM22 (predicted rRNA methylase)